MTAIWPILLFLASQPLPRGGIVDSVACLESPGHTYALYLPSGYTPERAWPVLIALDPAARGREPLERFAEGAESLGFVLAGSNDSRNGPLEPSAEALVAIWNDLQQRFAVDLDRIYLAGFSGGARMATQFAQKSKVAGALACGAGLLEGDPARFPFDYLATAGLEDMNYLEVRVLIENLQRRGSAAALLEFQGGHDWPPPPVARQALEWLELQAMRRGLRAPDPEFVQRYSRARLQEAERLEEQGRVFDAYRAYRSLSLDLEELGDASQARGRMRLLEDDPRLEEDRRGLERASEVERREIRVIMKQVLADRPRKSDQWWREKIESYRKLAERDLPDAAALSRRLINLVMGNAQEKAWFASQAGDFERARWLTRIAVVVRPESAELHYRLARFEALTGYHEDALSSLRRAVELGFQDPSRLAADDAFKKLRSLPEFRDLRASVARPSRP